MPDIQEETDGLGVVEVVEVPADRVWGAHAQHLLELSARRIVKK